MSAQIFIQFTLLLILFLILNLYLLSVNSCSNYLCKEPNISCDEQPGIPARHCIDYEKTIKTDKDKQAILHKMNNRRNKVARGEIRSFAAAGNMLKLQWSENLEFVAQRWADQCVGQGAPDITDKCLRDNEGQNIATIYGEAPGLSPLVLVDVWYMELLHMNASIVSQYIPSAETGLSHYDYFTQLVWAKSNYVGCGGVKFKEPRIDGKKVTYKIVNRLVCNFSPGGNQRHAPVYFRGTPCSLCPEECDSDYNALCRMIQPKSTPCTKDSNIIESNKTNSSDLSGAAHKNVGEPTQDSTDDETFTPYNFINFFTPTKEPVNISTTISKQCKDMAVDDFVDLLKKKLSSDPIFKDLASKSYPQTVDVTNADPNVAAFVSRVYSKEMPSTTTRSTENDFINSTLLVDLVEAVIFRSGDKTPITEESLKNPPSIDVNPIRIKAELSEIKLNQDFTGHYFFPEEENDDGDINTETTENTDIYEGEIPSFPMSDVVLDIEDFKLKKTTRDFLEEILESEPVSESHVVMYKREDETVNYKHSKKGAQIDISSKQKEKRHSSCDKYGMIKYSDILQQIAFDLKVLKLSERFHCTRMKNYSANNKPLLFTKILCTVLLGCILK